MQALLDAIPYVARAGLRLEDARPGYGAVRLPFNEHNLNHVGMLHAGALVLAAETAGGVACLSHPSLMGFMLLAKGLTTRYRKPGTASSLAVCQLDEADVARAAAEVEERGKADLDAQIEVRSDAGEVLCEVTVTYHFRKHRA